MLSRVAGVVGSPIDHSLSPVLHRAAYVALGLDWEYGRHRVGGEGDPAFPAFVAGLGPEWVGLSVTMPCKEPALELADRVSDASLHIGAANTLVRTDEGWTAYNTDPDGVAGALREAGVRDPARAVVLGGGATARSALVALSDMGVTQVTFVVRSDVRRPTADLAADLHLDLAVVPLGAVDEVVAVVAAADVVVSTLPEGSPLGAPAGFSVECDLTGVVLLDAVYANWPTPLARWAFGCGARVVSGTEMLLHQAVVQVELMTGRTAPVAAMREALLAAVSDD